MVTLARKSWRHAAILLSASLGAASVLAGAAPAVAGSSPGLPVTLAPGLVPGAAAPGAHDLSGVFCTSASNCWSVGSFASKQAALNQVLHWTGKRWFKVAVPNPGGTAKFDESELAAVRCTSASNCWAVGDYGKNNAKLDQVLHWTGKKWFVVPAPTPGGTLENDMNSLTDVACTSARSCWAVGSYGNTMEVSHTESEVVFNQALHWDGRKWSLVATPAPGGTGRNHVSTLSAIRCAAPGDCWAAGTYGQVRVNNKSTLLSQMLHWNGQKWAKVTVPSPGGTAKGSFSQLDGLSCTSASNCWAVGLGGRFGASSLRFLDLALRWDGRKWLRVGTPSPAGVKSGSINSLASVTCSSPRDCLAAGSAQRVSGNESDLNQVLRWNGVRWSRLKVPNPAGFGADVRQFLISVRCVSRANCWAVGVQQADPTPQQNEILHWNGTRWSASCAPVAEICVAGRRFSAIP